MKKQTNDRRTLRTRRALGDALVALILEKRYEAITIQDILDRADVGRSTFYAHYYDKDDLLMSEFERVVQLLLSPSAHGESSNSAFLPSLALFEHVFERQDLFNALAGGHGMHVLLETGLQVLTRNIEAHLAAALQKRTPDIPLSLLSNYIASTFLALIKWSFDNKMPYPPARMNEMFQQLVLPSVAAVMH